MLPGSMPPEGLSSNAEVKAIIEDGLTNLREWIHMRLQHQRLEHQEDMKTILEFLRVKGTGPEFPSIPMPESSGAVKDSCPERAWVSDRAGSAFDGSAKVAATGQDDCENAFDLCNEDRVEEYPKTPLQADFELRDIDSPTEDVPLPGCVNGSQQTDKRASDGKVGDSQEESRGERTDHMLTVQVQESQSKRNDDVVTVRDRPDHQAWQARLMDVFDQLDTDDSGTIDITELSDAFEEVGLPQVKAFETFMDMGSGRGSIDRLGWLRIIEDASRGTDEEVDLITEFLERLEDRQRRLGKVFQADKRKTPCLIVRHDSPGRMAWDLLMMLCLAYISLMLPFSMGFGKGETMKIFDLVLDVFFCIDIFLNFRTTFVDQEDATVVNGCEIAKRYLKSWFFLDFFSSVPFEELTQGLLPSFQPARLLKIGKVAKVMKLLRISKMLQVMEGSAMFEKLEENTASKTHQTALRVIKLGSVTFVIAHWLACFGAAVDGKKSISAYFKTGNGNNDDPDWFEEYIAAVYWAMTTLSTVGYGDITPTTDGARIYTVFAMVLGGAFYGYIIGSVTSVISDMDVNGRHFYARMDLVQSWLDSHEDVSPSLRRRIFKHFKQQLSEETAISDAEIFADLSPELRADTTFYIVHEKVRENPMFSDIPRSALSNIVAVLNKIKVKTNEFIVQEGDPGLAMYILVEGTARYGKGELWKPSKSSEQEPSSPKSLESIEAKFQKINPGDSFGEEIIFGLAESYMYSIVAATPCIFHHISEDDFTERFKNMPDLSKQMLANFIRSRSGRNERKENSVA